MPSLFPVFFESKCLQDRERTRQKSEHVAEAGSERILIQLRGRIRPRVTSKMERESGYSGAQTTIGNKGYNIYKMPVHVKITVDTSG
jgi:hypothetical protein